MENKNKILSEILEYTGKNFASLASQIGRKPQVLYDIRDGRVKNISLAIAMDIKEHYPDLSIEYMTAGKGKLVDASNLKKAEDQDKFNSFVLSELASIRAQIKGTLSSDELTLLEKTIGKISNY